MRSRILLCLFAIPAALALTAAPSQATLLSGQFDKGGYYRLLSSDLEMTPAAGPAVTCNAVEIVTKTVPGGDTNMVAVGGNGASHVNLGGCKAGILNAAIATQGNWDLTAKQRLQANPEEWEMAFTLNGATLTVPGSGCIVTIDAPQTIAANFTDDDPPALNHTSLAVDAAVSYVSNGQLGCPPKGAGVGRLEATLVMSANDKQDFTGSFLAVDVF